MKQAMAVIFAICSHLAYCMAQTLQYSSFEPINIHTQQGKQQQRIYADYNGQQYFNGAPYGMKLNKTNFMGQEEPIIKVPVYPKGENINQAYESPVVEASMGLTADDVMKQSNPRLSYGTSLEETQRANEDYIANQMKNNPAYNSELRNTNSRHVQFTPNQDLIKELQEYSRVENPATTVKQYETGYYKLPNLRKQPSHIKMRCNT